MPPALACFPVCSSFLALGLVAGLAVLVGWHRAADRDRPPAEGGFAADRPFPLWLFVAVPGLVLVAMVLIGLFGPDW